MSLDRILAAGRSSAPKEEHWIPLSDLMTGLMMLFMLIAVVFMAQVEAESEKVKALMRAAERQAQAMKALAEEAEKQAQRVKNVALLYDEMRDRLYQELMNEFRDDLPRWRAKLERDLTIRFEEPESLFDVGKAALKPQFGRILDDFFPRYVRILSGGGYRASIEEIRIEGHTSTVWTAKTGPDEAYFKNMDLSQARTRSVLEYALLLPQVLEHKRWLAARVTANGLSSSRPRLNADGQENREASQRVEFRVRTDAEARLGEILQAAQR